MKTLRYFLSFLGCALMLFSCGPMFDSMSGNEGDDPFAYENGGVRYGDCEGCQGFQVPDLEANVDGVAGFILVDETNEAVPSFLKKQEADEEEQDASGLLAKIKGLDGEDALIKVIDAVIETIGDPNQPGITEEDLANKEGDGSTTGEGEGEGEGESDTSSTEETANNEKPWGEFLIPKVSIVGVSHAYDSGGTEVRDYYFVFENMFLFTEPDPLFEADPWAESSPSTCQLFYVTGETEPTPEIVEGHEMQTKELQCVNPYLKVPVWDTQRRDRMMQFDDNNNLYFMAEYTSTNERAVFKYTKGGEPEEIINPEVNIDDWFVYGNGTIIMRYWMNHGSGIRILRYNDSTDNYTAVQVSNNNWEFNIRLDPENANVAYYYGRTTVSGEQTWQQCFYSFDSTVDDDKSTDAIDERSSQIADCSTDFWRKMEDCDWGDFECKNTVCADESYYPGNSATNLILVPRESSSQGHPNVVFVGEVLKKVPGTTYCDGYFDSNWGYCSDFAIAEDTAGDEAQSSADCTARSESWKDDNWFNRAYGELCDETINPTITRTINNAWCDLGGGNQERRYQMIGLLDMTSPNADGYGQVTPLSSENEEAMSAEKIEIDGVTKVLGATYDTGTYYLKLLDPADGSSQVLLEDVDIYYMGYMDGKIVLTGLYMPTNRYFTGEFDPAAVSGDHGINIDDIESYDITGTIEAMWIVAD